MSEFRTRRCFVALPLDEAMAADLYDALEGADLPGMRRVERANLHVTVKFLGDVEDPHMPHVLAALEMAVEGVEPFELQTGRTLYLPGPHRPRVLAVMLELPEALRYLVENLEDLLHEAGFRREGRAYRPHVTVGRFRERRVGRLPLPEAPQAASTGCRVDRIELMESTLQRGGPVYARLAAFPLAGDAA